MWKFFNDFKKGFIESIAVLKYGFSDMGRATGCLAGYFSAILVICGIILLLIAIF